MIEPLLQAERLLVHGMVEQAEQIYRRVAEQDPRNSIAVVGLARVALERGDDELALAHARAALEIDPQNAAAARLAARLSEVLTKTSAAEQPPDSPAGPEAPAATPAAPAAAADALPSEQVTFTRNPSMADHRRMEAQRDVEAEPAEQVPVERKTARRPGILRRLFGRSRGG